MLCFFLNEKTAREEGTKPALEVQWMWFPHFMANDVLMHKRLAKAWEKEWAGVLKTPLDEDDDIQELHWEAANLWLLEWVALQYPLVAGLERYLKGMLDLRQAA